MKLAWPLELDVAIELLNWTEDRRHHERTVTMNSEYYRMTKNCIKMSPGTTEFILHSFLPYNSSTNTEYLQNNSLRLRVSTATIHSTPFLVPAPFWQDPSNVSQSVCEFIITGFSKRKQSNNIFYSPSFYTHEHGYKICIAVYVNGCFKYKGTHIAVLVTIMAGDHDDQVRWPFFGDIVIELVNWRDDMRHYTKTIMTNGMSDKVTKGTVGSSYGLPQFISHSLLSYNPISNTEYLHNDSLCLRVKQAAVYSTLLLFKTPSWQDPRNVSKFVCEFTLSEFSKRKQFNNIFCSPPFYTHQHGYKMRLVVFANGSSSGQNTHISVYVKLMTGDNDDQLQWPFVGDVKFMLLNWREDKRHFMRTLSINAASRFIQVLQGDHGQCRGYPQFISKFSLPYNRSTNTEYLQDDCLRFRASMVNE